uniref:Uncharacterized protein n=1 Tax=Ditylenchus dipsaci TaxID=166011 RepID=A0A915DX74_9BILA
MLVKWKMLEPFERASNHMYEYASSLSIQLPIAKMLARDLDQMIEGQLQPIVEKMRMLLREKFFYLGEDKIHGLAIFRDARFRDRVADDKAYFSRQEQFRQLKLTIDPTTSNDCSTRKGIAVKEVAVEKAFPESESFSGNLLEEGTDVEEKLNVLTSNKHHLGNTALEQLDNLKKALPNRANRQKIDQVPSYKQISDDQRQAASREKKAEQTDRQLAMALEKSELNLLSHISAYAPGMGLGHPGAYGMISLVSGLNFQVLVFRKRKSS